MSIGIPPPKLSKNELKAYFSTEENFIRLFFFPILVFFLAIIYTYILAIYGTLGFMSYEINRTHLYLILIAITVIGFFGARLSFRDNKIEFIMIYNSSVKTL